MSSPPTTPEGEGLVEQVAFLKAVARFIEAEYVHARAISDHAERRRGKTDAQDWAHSRDDVDLAHADLMNYPAIIADQIASRLQALIAEVRGYQHHLRECEQIAGKALGYPWFKDDQTNFPGATEADGVCIGEHVGDTIVEELANRYSALIAEGEEMKAARSQPSGLEASPRSSGLDAERSAALDALDVKAFIEQGRKQQAARLAGQPFSDWLRALAQIADPDDPAGWLVGCVVLNEDCWFDYFAEGYTPASCWAEERSYD